MNATKVHHSSALPETGGYETLPYEVCTVQKPQIETGQVIDDRFNIQAGTEEGGQATVFRASDSVTEKEVAFKIAKINNDEEKERFEREVEFTRGFSAITQDIVPFVHSGTLHDGQNLFAYLATEYMPGKSLQPRLEATVGGLALGELLTVVTPAFRGASTINRTGLIHRDIKPANIFIGRDGEGKLGDLGIVSVESADLDVLEGYPISPESVGGTISTPGAQIGTKEYLAPEIRTGRGRYARSVDVYAAGAVLLRGLTGKLPEISTLEDRDIKAGKYSIPTADRFNDKTPDDVVDVTVACLEDDPANRPLMDELVEVLEGTAEELKNYNSQQNNSRELIAA